MSRFDQIIDTFNMEFSKFFTYSSIQAKIIATILAVILIIFLRRTIINLFVKRIDDAKTRYNWKRVTGYISFIFSIIIIGQIWLDGIGTIVTYIGLVSAGIAIALKDPLTNVAGLVAFPIAVKVLVIKLAHFSCETHILKRIVTFE